MKLEAVEGRTLFQTIVLFSQSGAGKTTLSATAPKPVIMDSNKGLDSIADVPGFEHIRKVNINKLKDMDTVYDNLSGTGTKDWSKKFVTVSLDHFDDIQGIVMDELGARRVAKDDRADEDEMQLRDYGIMGNKMRRYLRNLKKLPMHKILICGQAPNHDTGQQFPSLIGALRHQLPYFANHTLYLRVNPKTGTRWLHLNETEDFYAKTRARWLPPEMRKFRIDPNDTTFLTRFFALLAAGAKGFASARRTFLQEK